MLNSKNYFSWFGMALYHTFPSVYSFQQIQNIAAALQHCNILCVCVLGLLPHTDFTYEILNLE